MAVFDNFKNFIRQGKQAAAKNNQSAGRAATGASPPRSVKSHSDLDKDATDSPTDLSTDRNVERSTKRKDKDGAKQRKYDNAIKHIIEEENESRSRMPSFPGLEKYRLTQKMGDGAFSIVFQAVEIETGEPRAIKVVEKHNLTSSQRASVLKEAAIMRQLDHPSIVHMFAFLETPVHYFIVLELVPGGELFHQIVQLTYFSEDLSRHVITQVALAVRYLHEVAGVVHRDIKPENLLFTPVPIQPSAHRTLRPGDDESKVDEGVFTPGIGGGGVGTIKLADFGLSKVIWDAKTMTPCGTVGYTAPEIVKDERYSKSVDMWALGCVLYTILCGFPPFYDESIEVLTHKVAMGQYTFLSPWWDGISDLAKDLVSRLLTVDPEKRYTIDEFLQHPWITQSSQKPLPKDSEVSRHLASYGSVPTTPMNDRGGVRGGALKDAFDVSNAVYRLEQDMNRLNHKPRNGVIMEGDEDELDTDFSHIEHAFDKVHLGANNAGSAGNPVGTATTSGTSGGPSGGTVGSGSASRGTGSGSRTNKHSSPEYGSSRATARRAAAAAAAAGNSGGLTGGAFFDLHLEGSTLLERRKARQAPAAH